MLHNFEGKAFDVWFCSFVSSCLNRLIPSTFHTNYLNGTLGLRHPVLVSAVMTFAQKLGTYHLFMWNTSETEIMALFTCLSSLWKMWLKCWWNNDNYFSLCVSLISLFFLTTPLQSHLSTFPPSAWLINLFPAQYSTAWAHICQGAFSIFTATLYPSSLFLVCPSYFLLFHFFPFLSLKARLAFFLSYHTNVRIDQGKPSHLSRHAG